jgi:antitoxin VapB
VEEEKRFEMRRQLDSLDGICYGICHPNPVNRIGENEVSIERHVKLFKNGRNQAVRIPREFELPGEDAIMRKEGQRLIIEPAPPRSLLAVLAALPTLDEEFAPIKDAPAEPVDL